MLGVTMKMLLLLRHASAEGGANVGDHDRRLSPAGREEAAAVAARLAADDLRPDLALCSSARRAQETLEALTGVCDPGAVRVSDHLYLAPAADLLAAVREVDDAAARLLVVAHNPGLQRLALALADGGGGDGAGDGDGAVGVGLERFPPASLVGLRFEVARWDEVDESGGRVVLRAGG
jgi:phosphohistidine phosphatase